MTRCQRCDLPELDPERRMLDTLINTFLQMAGNECLEIRRHDRGVQIDVAHRRRIQNADGGRPGQSARRAP